MCTYLGSLVRLGGGGNVYVLGVFGEMGGCVRTWGLW